jgi:hypothetical protein
MAEDFGASVGQWVDRAGGRAREAFLAIGIDVLARVKELTPVDTGNLRAGWQLMRQGEELPVDRELLKDAGGLGAGLAGGWAGARAGAAAGARIGLAVGGAGGAAIGGTIGGLAGGLAGSLAAEEATGAAIDAAMPAGTIGGAFGPVTDTRPVAEVQLGETLVVVNPVVYARRIEFGWEIERVDGTTTTVRGAGMMAQTMSELPAIADRAVKRVLGEGA